jgi:MFS superfamily sulfate permease-like transporter
MPMTAVMLLLSLLFVSDALDLMPLVIVALVVSYVVAEWTKPSAPEPVARA